MGYEEPEIRKNYTGYEKDAESGLEFAQARYYNPTHGRFTSVDPLTASASIRDPQTFNRYSYVLNSAYKFTDPLGLLSVNSIACGQFCPNSGPQVDGSAFRGRDSSQDWTTMAVAPPDDPPTPGLLVQESIYTFTATNTDGSSVAQLEFTVTESVYLICDSCSGFDNLTTYVETTVNARNGPAAKFLLDGNNLELAANVAAEVIAEAKAQGVDGGVALGIAAKESFFGTVPGGRIPEMQSHVNPMKLTKNQFLDGTQPSATDMRHNVQHAIRLFKDDKMAGGKRGLSDALFRYGPGNAQDPDYVRKTMNYINEISPGLSKPSNVREPYIIRSLTIKK